MSKTTKAARMNDKQKALQEIMLSIFQLQASLTKWGDELGKSLSLTSSRWKVLGAIELNEKPLTVSAIAKQMGLTRQSVQRLVDCMILDGYLAIKTNPKDKRAMLVKTTVRGQRAYKDVMAKYHAWTSDEVSCFNGDKLSITATTLLQLQERISASL